MLLTTKYTHTPMHAFRLASVSLLDDRRHLSIHSLRAIESHDIARELFKLSIKPMLCAHHPVEFSTHSYAKKKHQNELT